MKNRPVNDYYVPGRWVKNHIRVSLSVHRFVSPLTYVKNHMPKSHSVHCLWPRLSPPLTVMQYIVYFRICALRHVFT